MFADSFANSTTDRSAAFTAAESGNAFAKSGSSNTRFDPLDFQALGVATSFGFREIKIVFCSHVIGVLGFSFHSVVFPS